MPVAVPVFSYWPAVAVPVASKVQVSPGVEEPVGVVVATDEGRADPGLVVVDRDVCDRHVAGLVTT